MNVEKINTDASNGTSTDYEVSVLSEDDKSERKLKRQRLIDARMKKRGPGIRASPRRKVCEAHTNAIFPKSSSRIGAEYQVEFLPSTGTYKNEKQSDHSYDLIWDYKEAAKKGMLGFIEDNVPYNKKEQALQIIHDNDYSLMNAKQIINQIDPTGASEWTTEDKEKFQFEIFRTRKNFKDILHTMGGKKMDDIIAYYLGCYKKSENYRLLKTVCVEERIEKAKDHCVICDQGGSLLICDGCESEWHMTCTSPALKNIPEGNWNCDVCVDRSFLEGRNLILQDMSSNVQSDRIHDEKKKLKEVLETNDTSKEVSLHAITTVKAFSSNISTIILTS
mmetsp:Transcript_931/g.1062  ORF Transcript_931/g.1062 Transcript_931/m.1062 type:complete len:334 (+) Transcript_931:143-1144(+)